MGKRLGAIAAACFALALCFALVGCGGGVDKTLYTGTWALESSNDSTFDAKTLELMKELDVQVTLTLNEDETGVLNILGNDPHTITWKATSDSEGELEIDGSTAKLTLEDGKLTMTDASNIYMSFVRSDSSAVEASSAAASSGQAASQSSASAESASAAADNGDEGDAEEAEEAEGAEGAEEGEEGEGAEETEE